MTENYRPLVIYHAGCVDGFGAAFVAYQRFGESADYHAAHYGEPPPDVRGREVYIVDFSYDLKTTVKIHEDCLRLIILDHHKTAQENLEPLKSLKFGNVTIWFDMERSGVGLTWDYFFAQHLKIPRPWWVNYIEDRDLWRWKLPNSRAVNAYISTIPFDFKEWENVFVWTIVLERAVEFGRIILDKIKQYNVTTIDRNCFLAEWWPDGAALSHYGSNSTWVPFVNAPYHGISELLEYAMDRFDTDISVGFSYSNKGFWQYSLRSRHDADVSKIARIYGGGGHTRAAGFEVDHLVVNVPTRNTLPRA